MKKLHHTLKRNTKIVFKHWSRKSYAAFVSIKREVKIGVLSVSVSTALGTKIETVCEQLFYFINEYCEDDVDEELSLVAVRDEALPLLHNMKSDKNGERFFSIKQKDYMPGCKKAPGFFIY